MNLQLSVVLSDIIGVTGQAIIRAIVAGERDPARLAEFRASNCKANGEQIIKALTGAWQTEHLFVLTQALAVFDHYTERIAACDQELERMLAVMESRGEPAAPLRLPRLPARTRSRPAHCGLASPSAGMGYPAHRARAVSLSRVDTLK
jgi:transposase